MPMLPFISDKDVEEAVSEMLIKANKALIDAENKFNKNVIDPFSAIFEMAGFNVDEHAWMLNEKARKAQKTLANHVGTFHQTILGKVQGWQNMGTGKIIDLLSTEKRIVAEIKNKHNTVTGSNLTHVYTKLENLVMPKSSHYKDYTAYYVVIIPKKPERYNLPFTPSDTSVGNRKPKNDLIRKTDGYTFYEMVTGTKDALLLLFQALPEIIEYNPNSKGFKFHDKKFLEDFFKAAFEK